MTIGPGLPLALLVGLVHTAIYVLVRGNAGGRLPLIYAAAALGAWAGAAIGGRLGLDWLTIGDFALVPASSSPGWASASWRSWRRWVRNPRRRGDHEHAPVDRSRVRRPARLPRGGLADPRGSLADLAELLAGESPGSRGSSAGWSSVRWSAPRSPAARCSAVAGGPKVAGAPKQANLKSTRPRQAPAGPATRRPPTSGAASSLSRGPAVDDAAFPGRSSRSDLVVVAGIMGLALVVRLLPVLRGGGLYGLMDYDDGVYFGSAVALVHGLIPYRDFLLLHPPGILYVLAPFAALGNLVGDATAFALARLAFMLLGAANAGLVALIAGRSGRRAALCAGVLYAVWPVAAGVERTTWLIAPQNTLLLLALFALSRPGPSGAPVAPGVRRSALAGVLLGLSFGCQLWGAVPLVVVLGWLVLVSRRQPGGWLRPALAYVIAAGVATAIVWLPFLVAAGSQMVRFVVLDQAGRPPLSGSKVARLRNIEGLSMIGTVGRGVPSVIVVAGFLGTAAAVAWAAWRRPAIRLWAALLAAQTVVLMVIPPFLHYAGWLGPAGALAIGGAADAIIGRRRPAGRPSLAFATAYTIGLGLLLVATLAHRVGTPFDAARAEAAIGSARCVSSDSPVLLIETGALHRDLEAGCPLRLDPSGTSYDTDRGLPRNRPAQPEYQRAMEAYYAGSDAALFMRLPGDGFSPETWAAIRGRLPVTVDLGPVTVLVPQGP